MLKDVNSLLTIVNEKPTMWYNLFYVKRELISYFFILLILNLIADRYTNIYPSLVFPSFSSAPVNYESDIFSSRWAFCCYNR